MNKEYIKILQKLESNGFIAYIVGGYVRDKLLNLPVTDVDIITNATPKDMEKIFNNIKRTYNEYGSIKLYIKDHIIDITTFRIESSYINGKPSSITYTSSLEQDLLRRDFTMNTLVMDSSNNIIDLLNGIKDINNRLIKPVKDPNILFEEDPSRLMRALRFMSTLDMELDLSISNYLLSHKEKLLLINNHKLKEELDKLFKSKKCINFINYIKQNNLEDYIGIHSTNFKYVSNLLSIYSELTITRDLPFTKYEKKQIEEIKYLVNKTNIDIMDIYKHGLYISTCAAELLSLPNRKINLMYTSLKIKGIIDIDIKSEELSKIFNIKGKELGKIINYIEQEIVYNRLDNNKDSIIERIKDYYEQHKE